MPNVNSVATELREMEKLLLDVFLVDESRLFPPLLLLPSFPMKIREDRGKVIIIVFCGHDTVFTCPVSSAAAQRVIWSDVGSSVLKGFKGFWKKNKVVELCGLITARELGSARALCVLWGCCTRTAFYLWFFQLYTKFQNIPPRAYAGFFPLKFMQFTWFLVLPLSYMRSFKIRKKNSHGHKFPERLVFSLAFVTWLDVVLVTPGTPESTGWQWLSLERFLEIECFLSVGWGCQQDGLLWLSNTTVASE